MNHNIEIGPRALRFPHWHFLLVFGPLLVFIYSIWDRNVYIGGDIMIPLDPINNFDRIYSWDNGLESFRYAYVLWFGFYYLLFLVGIPVFITQKVLLVLPLTIGFTFTYLLYKELFGNTKYGDPSLAFLSAVIFTFNPIYFMLPTGYLPLYGFPICYYLLIKFVQKGTLAYAGVFSLSLNWFFFVDLPQPKQLIVFSVSSLFLLMVYKQVTETKVRTICVRLMIVATVAFFLNSWVFFPLINSLLFGSMRSIAGNVASHGGDADLGVSSLLYITRFINYNTIRGYPQVSAFLTGPAFIVWSFAQWIIVGAGMIYARYRREEMGHFLILTCVGAVLSFILIAKGSNPPFGDMYREIILNVPLARIFRTSSSVVAGAVTYFAILLAICTYYLAGALGVGRILIYSVAVANILICYPIYMGHKFYNSAGNAAEQKGYVIPVEYYEMGRTLDALKDDSKVLSLPPKKGYVKKRWHYYGPDIMSWITKKDMIYREDDYGLSMVSEGRDDGEIVSKGQQMRNIGHVLVQKDGMDGDPENKSEWGSGRLVARNEYFDLYSLEQEDVVPKVYVTSGVAQVWGRVSATKPLMGLDYFKDRRAILIKDQNRSDAVFRRVESEDDMQAGIKGGGLEGDIIMADMDYEEFIVEVAATALRRSGEQEIASHSSVGRMKIKGGNGGTFNIGEEGTYEIWKKCMGKDMGSGEKARTDHRVGGGDAEEVCRWRMAARRYLHPGMYNVGSLGTEGETKVASRSNIMKEGSYVIISSKVKDRYEGHFRDRFISYLQYGKVRQGVKVYSNGSGMYNPRIMLTPRERIEQGVDMYGESIVYEFVGRNDRKQNQSSYWEEWRIWPHNAEFSQTMDDGDMNISARFDGPGDEDEFIRIVRFYDNALKETPYMALTYDISDPSVQGIQVVYVVRSASLGNVERRVVVDTVYSSTGSRGPVTAVIDAYSRAKSILASEGEVYLTRVELILRKRRGTDCSRPNMKRWYQFSVNRFVLLKNEPPRLTDDRVTHEFADPSTYYYSRLNRISQARDWGEIPHDVGQAFRPIVTEGVDLERNPWLSIVVMNGMPKSYAGELTVLLNLDSDGDGHPDVRVPVKPVVSNIGGGREVLFVKALEEVRKVKERSQQNLLVGVTIIGYDAEWYYRTLTKRLREDRRVRFPGVELDQNSPVMMIDDRVYRVRDGRKIRRGKGAYWIEYGPIPLGEGDHVIKYKSNQKWKVEGAMIEHSASKGKRTQVTQVPNILGVQKINPTRYVVSLDDVKAQFVLIFNEQYHDGWRMYVRPVLGGKGNTEPQSALWSAWTGRGKRVEVKKHFLANGFANGWLVSPSEHGSVGLKSEEVNGSMRKYEIVLEYKPQRLFEGGLAIAGIMVCGWVGNMVYARARKRKGG